MRVVLANKFLHPQGGAERAVLTLGRELAERGHDVSYFGMQHPANVVHGENVGLVSPRDYRGAGPGRYRDAASMLYSLAARRAFGRFLERRRPDVVHAHNIYHQLTPAVLDAAHDQGIPVVMTLHDYKLVCPRYDMLRHGSPCDACIDAGPTACLRFRCAGSWGASCLLAAEALLHRLRGSYDGVRRFVAPSRFLVHMLLRAGLRPERLRYVPNCAPGGDAVPVSPTPGRFAYVGRLSAEKGVVTLVRAAARLSSGTLVVCGAGPHRAEVERAAAAAPAGRVLLRGHLDAAALQAEIGAASFVAVPSEWYENAPFSVLEAMAAGRAVLASRLGGLPELVSDGETGWLVPAGDVDAWAAALERTLAAPHEALACGERARHRAQEEYGLARHADRMLGIYSEAIGS